MRERGGVLQVENIPVDLLRAVKVRAAQDGRTVRDVTIGLLRRYAAGEVEPAPPPTPPTRGPQGASRETTAPRAAPGWTI